MVAAATATGTQDLTISGLGWTPKACILTVVSATAKNALTDAIMLSRGFAVSTTEHCMGVSVGNGNGTIRARRAQRNTDIVYLQTQSGTTRGVATSSGAISNGWRINWGTAATAAYYILCEFFGGTDLSAALVEFAPKTTAGTKSHTGLSFQPNLLFTGTSGYGAGNNAGAHAIYSFGVAADHSGGIKNRLLCGQQGKDAAATTEINTWFDEDECCSQTFDGTTAWSAEVTAFTTDGFTMTTTGSTGSDVVHVLCLDTGDHDPWCGTIDSPTSAAADWDVNGPGFEPLAAGIIGALTQSGEVGVNQTNASGNNILFGAFDGTREHSVGLANDDANTNENTGTFASDQFVFVTDADDLDTMDLSSPTFDAGGWLINAANITTADSTQRKWVAWAIEGDGGGGGGLSIPVAMRTYRNRRVA